MQVDAYGHVYLSGYFRGSAYFGYKKWHLTAIGSSNAFVLRYQPAGPLDWAFAVGSTGDGAGNGIAINHGHELYIAGPFQDSVGLNTSAGFQSAGSAGGNDVFLAKLSICEPLKGNVIKASGSQTICYHSLPPKIVEDTFVTGGDHWFSYSWQMSTDGVHFYEPQSYIYNDQNYLQAEALDTTTWFRMVMISGTGCGEKISDTVKITVLRPITGNYINAEQTTCYNEAPQALTTLDTITGDSLNFLWESSTDGTHYNIIADATKEQYQPGALLSTTYFRRVIVQGGGCGNTDTSNVIKINVLPALTGNSIDSSQKICIGSAPDTLRTASAAQGGNGSFTYIWQSSTVSATDSFQNIANSNTENYAPGVLYQTTWYRRKAVSDCGTLISNAIQITADSCGTGISLSANPESALISISPNPFTNQAKLHCTFTLRSQIQIDILSLQGNVVEKIYQGPAVSQDYILDGSALNPAVYVVRIQGNQLLEYRKILVIK